MPKFNKDVVLIGASMAALVAVSAVTFFCSRRRRQQPSSASRRSHDVEIGVAGLDEAVLAAYPTLVFSSPPPPPHHGEEEDQDGEVEKKTTTAPGGGDTARCAVCQADYADGDELRLLPDCRHAFHRVCVDQWLRRRATCPVCRSGRLA